MDSKEDQDQRPTSSTPTSSSGRPGPVENVHFEFFEDSNASGSNERESHQAPNGVIGDINCEVDTEIRQQGSQVDRNQPPVYTRRKPTMNEDLSSVEGQGKSQCYCGRSKENVQTASSAAKEQHPNTVCMRVEGAFQTVTVEKSADCREKVEADVSDFSDMSQAFYQALKREQEDQNIPIRTFSIGKQATIHEDHQPPIHWSGQSEKKKEKKTVTETVLNNDPSEKKGATEEDQEKQEDRELRQLWLTDLC